MPETQLVRTTLDSKEHALVLRESVAEPEPFGPALEFLPDDESTDELAVTYRDSARVLHEWHGTVTGPDRNVGVVSVGETMRSAAAESSPVQPMVRGVADPTDLEAVREEVKAYLETWPVESRTVVYFDSVTELLDRFDVAEVTDFLREFHRLLDVYDAVGYFGLTQAEHDRSVVRKITLLFDTVVKRCDGTSEVRSKPSVSDCFDVVADSRRRHVLAVVAEREEISVANLADRVAMRESSDPHKVEVALVNLHLPKLADFGVLDYEHDGKAVAQGEHFDRIVPFVRKAQELK